MPIKKKLPLWKTIVFSLIPAVLLFVLIEGASRIVWYHLEAQAEAKDLNKLVNFNKIFDPVLGFKLMPNVHGPESIHESSIGPFHFKFPVQFYTNSRGYMQRDEVAEVKKPGSLRIITVGESTTEGNHVDQSYPSVLRSLLHDDPNYSGGVEVINAGVPGFVSDQWKLYAQTELAALKPDIVVFYAGWNDFQGYNPHIPPPTQSFFERAFSYLPGPANSLKSVTLLSALLEKLTRKAPEAPKNPIDNLDLSTSNVAELKMDLDLLVARRQRYVEKLQDLQAETSKRADKIQKRTDMIKGVDGQVEAVKARIQSLQNSATASVVEANDKAHIRRLYKFYIRNLDATVDAFKKRNPDVRIVISTLVGRWPYKSESYFLDGNNAVWWMKTGLDNSQTAYQHLARFNDLIRDHAKEKGWHLVDAAQRFESVNREEIQWDFAHMTDVGYRMLAETIYHGMLDQGVLK
jgi:lysophospholipase L1-like esterase